MEQRYHAVLEVITSLVPVSEVAERYGVSRQTVHAWLARYEAEGLPGLADHSHRPRHHPWQLDAEVAALICQLRRSHHRWGPRRLPRLTRDERSHRAVAVVGVSGAGARAPGAVPTPQTQPGLLSAMGAAGADGAVADGHHRVGVPGRWQ